MKILEVTGKDEYDHLLICSNYSNKCMKSECVFNNYKMCSQ